MQIITKDLKLALNRAKKLTGATESNTVSFQVEGSKLSVVCVAETSRLKQLVNITGESAGFEKPLYLDKTMLSDVVATRIEDLPLDFILGGSKLKLKQGEFSATFSISQGSYIFELGTDFEPTWTVDGKWLSHVLDACAAPVDKDATKTKGVLLDLRTENVCVIGSDSLGPGQVHVFDARSSVPIPGQLFCLSRQSAQFLADLGLGNLSLEKNGRRLVASGEDIFYRVSAIRNNYPNEYRQFFQLNAFPTWTCLNVNKSDFLYSLNSIEAVMSASDVAYKFSIAERSGDKYIMSISAKNEKLKSEAVDRILIEGNLTRPIEFVLRRSKVESSLKYMQSETIAIRYEASDSPIIMTEIPDSGFRAIHLPLRS